MRLKWYVNLLRVSRAKTSGKKLEINRVVYVIQNLIKNAEYVQIITYGRSVKNGEYYKSFKTV